MKKSLVMMLVAFMISPVPLWAQGKAGGFGNGLGYQAQMGENINRGSKEIVESPKQIPPSFKEQEHTKLSVPGAPICDGAMGCFLAVINVADSICRGAWRILVAPLPVVQKVQP